MSNNKQRIFNLIKIFKEHSDANHKLKLNDLVDYLKLENIKIKNRKTIYDDINTLNKNGFDIEYDSDGYYLSESPFTLSEIKILIDSINSLKNMDDKFLKELKDKLYGYISDYQKKFLINLEYDTKHRNKKFINRLEDVLNALINKKALSIKRTNKRDEEEIVPLFLHRVNDYYYLYYHYLNSRNIYHTRFDNINSINFIDKKDDISISKREILNKINESTNSFHSKDTRVISFETINKTEYLESRIIDEFPNAMITKNGFSIKASINNLLFLKIASFNNDIKIINDDIRKEYLDFLNELIVGIQQ